MGHRGYLMVVGILAVLVGLLLFYVAYQNLKFDGPGANLAAGSMGLDSYSGNAYFANGSWVQTGIKGNGAGCICVSRGEDLAVSSNGTRVLFSAKGIIATIYPYAGEEKLADGTTISFSPCIYPILNPQGYGLSANGTFTVSESGGEKISFFSDGSCLLS